jgi:hypothetical protein
MNVEKAFWDKWCALPKLFSACDHVQWKLVSKTIVRIESKRKQGRLWAQCIRAKQAGYRNESGTMMTAERIRRCESIIAKADATMREVEAL